MILRIWNSSHFLGLLLVAGLSSCAPLVVEQYSKNVTGHFTAAQGLMKTHCFSCHGVGSSSSDFESLKTEDQWIASAKIIPGNPEASILFMQLKSKSNPMPPSGRLDPASIEVFANWIRSAKFGGNSGPTVTQPSLQRPRLMPRDYVASVLRGAFGNHGAIANLRFDEVAMGGGCDVYDPADCAGSSTKQRAASTIPDLSPMRQGLIKKVCRQLVEDPTSLNTALSRVSAATPADGVQKAYQLFYPGQSLSPELLGSLSGADSSLLSLYENTRILASATESGPISRDGMKAVLYTLCQSPEWHIP